MKKILLLLAVMPMILLSCSNELTLEEQIAEEEKALTDTEKQLLHQTPKYESESLYVQRVKIDSMRQAEMEDIGGWQIQKNSAGQVTWIEYKDNSLQQPPRDGRDFLILNFGEAIADQFRFYDFENRNPQYEQYKQYCGDLEVSSYVFLYDAEGVMTRARGEYIPTDGLSPEPSISSYVARMIFASYLNNSVQIISEKTPLRIELIPDGTRFVPTLIYYLRVNVGEGPIVEYHVAWVDAHSGRLLTVYFESI